MSLFLLGDDESGDTSHQPFSTSSKASHQRQAARTRRPSSNAASVAPARGRASFAGLFGHVNGASQSHDDPDWFMEINEDDDADSEAARGPPASPSRPPAKRQNTSAV